VELNEPSKEALEQAEEFFNGYIELVRDYQPRMKPEQFIRPLAALLDKLTRERDEARAETQRVYKANEVNARLADERLTALELAEASIAGAYRGAAKRRCQWCEQGIPLGGRYGHTNDYICKAKDILALTPIQAIRAEKMLVAQAMDKARLAYESHIHVGPHDKCGACGEDIREDVHLVYGETHEDRIRLFTAALEAIKKEKPDADV
jgi:hypothetical protein